MIPANPQVSKTAAARWSPARIMSPSPGP